MRTSRLLPPRPCPRSSSILRTPRAWIRASTKRLYGGRLAAQSPGCPGLLCGARAYLLLLLPDAFSSPLWLERLLNPPLDAFAWPLDREEAEGLRLDDDSEDLLLRDFI